MDFATFPKPSPLHSFGQLVLCKRLQTPLFMTKLAACCRRYGLLYLQLIPVDPLVISNTHVKEREVCLPGHSKLAR
jgi:hypothetical protein